MSRWYCTACATLVSGGFPFEEKAIGGVGPRTCSRCKATKDRDDGMHLVSIDSGCKCSQCLVKDPLLAGKMVVCQTCGNKRCPKATYHENECTASNEPGQPGSEYSRIDG